MQTYITPHLQIKISLSAEVWPGLGKRDGAGQRKFSVENFRARGNFRRTRDFDLPISSLLARNPTPPEFRDRTLKRALEPYLGSHPLQPLYLPNL